MTAWIGLGVVLLIGFAVVGVSALVIVRLIGYKRASGAETQAAEYEPERYAPLMRLVAGTDAEFLRREASCGSRLAADWDRARRDIIRIYLNELAADFEGLHSQAKALVAEAPEQYASLAGTLMHQQLTFWTLMAGVEVRLLLSRLGIGRVDVQGLVQTIEAMHAQIAGPAVA